MNYDQFLNNAEYYSFLVKVKENQRALYIADVLDCLSQSEEVVQLIKQDLKNTLFTHHLARSLTHPPYSIIPCYGKKNQPFPFYD